MNQLPLLIDYYRSSWNELSNGSVDRDFPFYFVQLPSWLQDQSEPVEADAAWAVSREMMRLVSNSVKNTGVAVSVDTGDSILLHPVDKKPIGLRLAYLALKETYGRDFVVYGPRCRSHEIKGDMFIITFDSIGSGMKTGRCLIKQVMFLRFRTSRRSQRVINRLPQNGRGRPSRESVKNSDLISV